MMRCVVLNCMEVPGEKAADAVGYGRNHVQQQLTVVPHHCVWLS